MSDFNQKNPYNYDLILTPYFGLRYFETRTVASLDGSNIWDFRILKFQFQTGENTLFDTE